MIRRREEQRIKDSIAVAESAIAADTLAAGTDTLAVPDVIPPAVDSVLTAVKDSTVIAVSDTLAAPKPLTPEELKAQEKAVVIAP